jgi:hypothetical protein
MKSRWLWLLGIIAGALLLYLGIKWWNRDVIQIKAVRINRGSIEQLVTASGFVNAPVYELGPKNWRQDH